MTQDQILTLALYALAFIATYIVVGAIMLDRLWVYYLAVMSLARAKDAGLLTPLTNGVGTLVLIRGLLLDFIVNVFVMTPLLREWPRETTVTARLKRHNQRSPLNSWGKRVALWFEPVLDPFDPKGDHI